ncbi:bifunctional precorrin-2 dehydrogenase/sirohydrochlorin ferrochelatase [Streptacidiphilus monticola]
MAQRRLPTLIAAGARIDLIAPETTPAVQAMADAGELVWHQRAYAPGDLAEAWYVLVATGDPEANAAASAEAEANRVFCARSDDATAASAWTPASGRHGATTVAVTSGDPRHSAALRDAVVAGLRDGSSPPPTTAGTGAASPSSAGAPGIRS